MRAPDAVYEKPISSQAIHILWYMSMEKLFLNDWARPRKFLSQIHRRNFPQFGLEGEKSAENCDFRENERAPA